MSGSRYWLVVLVALSSACAPAAQGTGGGPARNSQLITTEEIKHSTASNAYVLVESLRPRWLARGSRQTLTGAPEVAVYMGGVRLGGVEVLRSIATSEVAELRFLDAGAAQSRFGSGHMAGVILLTPAGQ